MATLLMSQALCRQQPGSSIPLKAHPALLTVRPLPCHSIRECRHRRASLHVCAVAADKVSSTVAEVPKVKANKAKLTEMSPETAKDLYRDMFLGREFEEMCAQMYYRGKMFGFVHLYSGQEAVSTGVIRALRADDYICSTYRDHVHALSKNVPAKNIMAELFGKKTGICRGQGGSMHMFSAEHGLVSTCKATNADSQLEIHSLPLCLQLGGFAFIGEGIPIGLGAAFKIKYKKVGVPKWCLPMLYNSLL